MFFSLVWFFFWMNLEEKTVKPSRDKRSWREMPSKCFCSCPGFHALLLEHMPKRLDLEKPAKQLGEARPLVQGQRALVSPSASKCCLGFADNTDSACFKWGFSNVTVNKKTKTYVATEPFTEWFQSSNFPHSDLTAILSRVLKLLVVFLSASPMWFLSFVFTLKKYLLTRAHFTSHGVSVVKIPTKLHRASRTYVEIPAFAERHKTLTSSKRKNINMQHKIPAKNTHAWKTNKQNKLRN